MKADGDLQGEEQFIASWRWEINSYRFICSNGMSCPPQQNGPYVWDLSFHTTVARFGLQPSFSFSLPVRRGLCDYSHDTFVLSTLSHHVRSLFLVPRCCLVMRGSSDSSSYNFILLVRRRVCICELRYEFGGSWRILRKFDFQYTEFQTET